MQVFSLVLQLESANTIPHMFALGVVVQIVATQGGVLVKSNLYLIHKNFDLPVGKVGLKATTAIIAIKNER